MTPAKKVVRTGGTQQRPAPVVVRRALRPVAPASPSLQAPEPAAPPVARAVERTYATSFERAEAYRTRHTERVIADLAPREAEVVARLVAAGGGGGAPWRIEMVKQVAAGLGVTSRRLQVYLMALRRTLGRSVPRRSETTGPMVRGEAWIHTAMETRSWGPFQPLVGADWPGCWAPEPPTGGEPGSATPRFPTRRPPRPLPP